MFWTSLSVRLSVFSTHGHHFSEHFSRRGTVLAGQSMLKLIVQTVIIGVQFFRAAKIFVGNDALKWVSTTLPLCKQSPFKGDTACGRMLVFHCDCPQSTIRVFTVRRIVPQKCCYFTTGV